MTRFSVVGFVVGALCAILLYSVGVTLVSFVNEGLVFGIAALLLWLYLSFNWRW